MSVRIEAITVWLKKVDNTDGRVLLYAGYINVDAACGSVQSNGVSPIEKKILNAPVECDMEKLEHYFAGRAELEDIRPLSEFSDEMKGLTASVNVKAVVNHITGDFKSEPVPMSFRTAAGEWLSDEAARHDLNVSRGYVLVASRTNMSNAVGFKVTPTDTDLAKINQHIANSFRGMKMHEAQHAAMMRKVIAAARQTGKN